jgi:hypothetical protein
MRQFLVRSGMLLLCICCLFIAENAFAGNITLRMQMTLTISSDRIKVQIAATNQGTEPARDLRASLHIFDRVLTSEIISHLNVNETRSFLFLLPLPADKKGRFPFLGEVLYHDANLQPFSALSSDVFKLKHKVVPDLIGSAPDLTIKGKGNLPVRIANPLSRPVDFTATLHLPLGLTTPEKQKRFTIDPNKEKTVEFQLFDRYEIGSAAYPVFCILEYEIDGLHDTTIVRPTVRIKALKNWFKKTKWYWLGGLVPIVLMWLGVFLLRKNENPNCDI